MRKRWKAAPGAMFKDEQAQAYGRQIEAIARRDGYVTPELVVEEAREESSPLHPAFEWDESVAAERWRMSQARNLMNHLVVVVRVDHTEKEVKGLYNVRVVVDAESQETEPGYVTYDVAVQNKGYREQILRRALAEMQSWRERYQELRELTGVFRAIARASRAVEEKVA